MQSLTIRQQRALEAFNGREFVYFYDLAPGVGRKTMCELVKLGVVNVVEDGLGIYAKNYRWQLVH